MADALWKNRLMPNRLWGRLSLVGLAVALVTFVLDQASKLWVLEIINIDERPPIQITPFMDLAMAWNEGVSYGLLATNMQPLLVGISLLISAVLWIWLARAKMTFVAVALGLLLGGAIGNALDRLVHGAVADFVHLHWGTWSWYVFNVADIAIVAGVALLVYDGLFGSAET